MKVLETNYKGRKIKEVFTKDEKGAIPEIRNALEEDGIVEVVNQYETFYGVGFDGWLRNSLSDMNVEYEILSYNQWEGYPWDYIITIKK